MLIQHSSYHSMSPSDNVVLTSSDSKSIKTNENKVTRGIEEAGDIKTTTYNTTNSNKNKTRHQLREEHDNYKLNQYTALTGTCDNDSIFPSTSTIGSSTVQEQHHHHQQQQQPSSGGSAPPPKCICTWKNCRAYQKAFYQIRHPVFDGVIQIKIIRDNVEYSAYKECLDRTLGITKEAQWKKQKQTQTQNDSGLVLYCRYIIAKHHFTEQHIKMYENNPKVYSFIKPFTFEGAKKNLFYVNETIEASIRGNNNNVEGPALYFQCPNVPSEVVKVEYHKIMERLRCNNNNNSHNDNDNNSDHTTMHVNSPKKTPIASNRKVRQHPNDIDAATTSTDVDNSSVGTSLSHLEMLKRKEAENTMLKEQLDAMKNQLTMLHFMVEKLQSQQFVNSCTSINSNSDNVSVYSRHSSNSSTAFRRNNSKKSKTVLPIKTRQVRVDGGTMTSRTAAGPAVGKSTMNNPNSNASTSSICSLSRDPVPEEIDVNDDDGESRTLVSQWTNENFDDSEVQTQITNESSAQMTNATFHSTTNKNNNSTSNYRQLQQLLAPANDDDDEESVEEEDQENEDETYDNFEDYVSVGTSTLLSASRSVKSLPREMELAEENEDDDESSDSSSDSNNEDEQGDVPLDNRYGSLCSSQLQSSSNQSMGTFATNTKQRKQTRNRQNVLTSTSKESNNNSRASNRSRKDTYNTPLTPTLPIESMSISTDNDSSKLLVYEVKCHAVTDPYGEKGTYTGSISKETGMPHGYGRLEYDEAGRWYEGDWEQGHWTGYGCLSNGDGDYYEGGVKNDLKHGRGFMQFADGRTFDGRYFDGQMVHGKMTYEDGSTYEGSWLDGMRHGFGRCAFADESVYQGEFLHGKFHGQGKMIWNDGGYYDGAWSDGEMHGSGREIRADGSLRHDGEWSKGQPVRY